jgi:hypothetical protein
MMVYLGVTTSMNDAVPVVIDSTGNLGTASSSRRYKESISDIGEASERLYDLRPVTFRYQQPYADGEKPIQYGLIAEEVAEVLPELVVRNTAGNPETVKYQDLTPMLLNEVQKLRLDQEKAEQGSAELRQETAALREGSARARDESADLRRRLEKLEAAVDRLAP